MEKIFEYMPPEWLKIKYRGKTIQELLEMPMDEIVKLLPARARRSLKRGLSEEKKKLLEKVLEARKALEEGRKIVIKTHIRDMIVLPMMVGLTFSVYNGKEYVTFTVSPEMIGHYLGEYSVTTKKVEHGEPGLKATRSSLFVAMK